MTGWDTDLGTGVSEDTPQAPESERAVLAAAMWSAESMLTAVQMLSDDDWI
jgi:hypothetical protein